jgi:hypothetical protein
MRNSNMSVTSALTETLPYQDEQFPRESQVTDQDVLKDVVGTRVGEEHRETETLTFQTLRASRAQRNR